MIKVIFFNFGESLTCCEGRAIADVASLPVRAVCPTDVVVVSTDDNRSLGAKVSHISITVHENCAVLEYYAASCGDCLPTFRHNVSVPS
jgi:hypothetical protein